MLSKEEIKNIQIEMLSYIHKICEENDITYFLAYGSLLGAIRHKGFIPWDDDIDIWVLRKDYDKLKKIINDKSLYKFCDVDTSKKHLFDFGKIVDTTTSIKEDGVRFPSEGIFIDVFPLDYFEDNLEDSISLVKKLKTKKKYFSHANCAVILKNFTLKSFIKNFYVLFKRFVGLFYSYKKRIINYDNLNLNRSLKGSKNYIGYVDSIFNKDEMNIYKTSWFEKTYVQFENITVCVPKYYDELLSFMYGDYMKLPPEEERFNHGLVAFRKKDI